MAKGDAPKPPQRRPDTPAQEAFRRNLANLAARGEQQHTTGKPTDATANKSTDATANKPTDASPGKPSDRPNETVQNAKEAIDRAEMAGWKFVHDTSNVPIEKPQGANPRVERSIEDLTLARNAAVDRVTLIGNDKHGPVFTGALEDIKLAVVPPAGVISGSKHVDWYERADGKIVDMREVNYQIADITNGNVSLRNEVAKFGHATDSETTGSTTRKTPAEIARQAAVDRVTLLGNDDRGPIYSGNLKDIQQVVVPPGGTVYGHDYHGSYKLPDGKLVHMETLHYQVTTDIGIANYVSIDKEAAKFGYVVDPNPSRSEKQGK